MTGRDRILAAFRGETPDTVPFCPNLHQWFYYHKITGALPAELEGASHPFDALRFLGADILARWDTQRATRERYSGVVVHEEYAGDSHFDEPVVTAFNAYPPRKSRRHREFVTPHGVLRETWVLSEEAGADFISEYRWKEWSEYEAVRFLLEATDYEFEREEFRQWLARVGDDGVLMVHLTQSPLKTFHWLCGAENASLFIADHPGEMRELAAVHEAKALGFLERIVDLPEAEVLISLDNLDSAFCPPWFYAEYCDSFFSRAAEVIHRRGKIFVVHACGHNRALLPLVGRSSVDCLEGLTPPPTGNVELGQARQLSGYARFTVNGGIDTSNLEARPGAEAHIHAYTRQLFDAMGDKRHFIFGSSCSTPAVAPWENLVYFRDAARAYGRIR